MAPDQERDERPRPRRDDPDGERSRRHDDSKPQQSLSRRSRRKQNREIRKAHEDRRSRSPDDRDQRRRTRDRDYDHDIPSKREKGRKRSRSRSRSREETDAQPRRRRRHDPSPPEDTSRAIAKRKHSPVRGKAPLPSQKESFAVTQPAKDGDAPPKPKEKPNLGNTGRLAALSNSVAQADGTSITLLYHEPPEARKASPRDEWKLYVFKGRKVVDTLDLSARSCWLVGREKRVVDLLSEHPSVSKQHAVIQFRYTEQRNEFGDKVGRVRPYVIDLGSANGTVLNDALVPTSRYLELKDQDLLQFGASTREYVVMLAPKD